MANRVNLMNLTDSAKAALQDYDKAILAGEAASATKKAALAKIDADRKTLDEQVDGGLVSHDDYVLRSQDLNTLTDKAIRAYSVARKEAKEAEKKAVRKLSLPGDLEGAYMAYMKTGNIDSREITSVARGSKAVVYTPSKGFKSCMVDWLLNNGLRTCNERQARSFTQILCVQAGGCRKVSSEKGYIAVKNQTAVVDLLIRGLIKVAKEQGVF